MTLVYVGVGLLVISGLLATAVIAVLRSAEVIRATNESVGTVEQPAHVAPAETLHPRPQPSFPPAPTPTPDPPVVELPEPEQWVDEVACPAGEVVLVRSGIQITEHPTHAVVWVAGAVHNRSEAPVQLRGQISFWAVSDDGVQIAPVPGSVEGDPNYLLPGAAIGFRASSNALSVDELAAIADLQFSAGYFGAAFIDVPLECATAAPVSEVVM